MGNFLRNLPDYSDPLQNDTLFLAAKPDAVPPNSEDNNAYKVTGNQLKELVGSGKGYIKVRNKSVPDVPPVIVQEPLFTQSTGAEVMLASEIVWDDVRRYAVVPTEGIYRISIGVELNAPQWIASEQLYLWYEGATSLVDYHVFGLPVGGDLWQSIYMDRIVFLPALAQVRPLYQRTDLGGHAYQFVHRLLTITYISSV